MTPREEREARREGMIEGALWGAGIAMILVLILAPLL